jgi:hypothetical protein
MTTVIVGVGFMAMLQLLATGTVSNLRGAQTTTGVNLAKNIREMTLKLPFAQLKALNNTTHSPPIDSRGVALEEFDDWSQVIEVKSVDPDRLTLDVNDPDPVALRFTVTAQHAGQEVCRVSWYAFNGSP